MKILFQYFGNLEEIDRNGSGEINAGLYLNVKDDRNIFYKNIKKE